jgi:endonuclease/exonuclease/phosphatase family metal-dependent hydrolase
MTPRFLLLPVALLLGTACQAPLASGRQSQGVGRMADVAPSEPVVLRVLSYNIRHGEGRDRRIDLGRIVDVMKSVDPDLIALQEVDRWTDRAGGVDQFEELAWRMGMHAEFGKAIDYGGGEYGVAVLSRWPIQSAENRMLPSSEYYEQRTALTVRVRAGERGPVLVFTGVHLSTSREVGDALGQVTHLNELLTAGDTSLSILAGDFNAAPDTEVMQVLQGEWMLALPAPLPQPATTAQGIAPTASSGPTGALAQGPATPAGTAGPNGPGRGRGGGPRNDFVLYRPVGQWRVVESRFIDDTVASDHRPVLTVLEWAGTKP